MNFKRAQEILRLSHESKTRRRHYLDVRERVEFLRRWIKSYTEELSELEPSLTLAREEMDRLPSREDITQAQSLIDEVNSLNKEIAQCERKKRRIK